MSRMVSVPRDTRHMYSAEVEDMVLARQGICEISDECAVTIASWWQGPAGHGATFAALVSHFPVSVEDLHAAIADARKDAGTAFDRLALDMLATWALHYASGADEV
jgi:hypothetical protein